MALANLWSGKYDHHEPSTTRGNSIRLRMSQKHHTCMWTFRNWETAITRVLQAIAQSSIPMGKLGLAWGLGRGICTYAGGWHEPTRHLQTITYVVYNRSCRNKAGAMVSVFLSVVKVTTHSIRASTNYIFILCWKNPWFRTPLFHTNPPIHIASWIIASLT